MKLGQNGFTSTLKDFQAAVDWLHHYLMERYGSDLGDALYRDMTVQRALDVWRTMMPSQSTVVH